MLQDVPRLTLQCYTSGKIAWYRGPKPHEETVGRAGWGRSERGRRAYSLGVQSTVKINFPRPCVIW